MGLPGAMSAERALGAEVPQGVGTSPLSDTEVIVDTSEAQPVYLLVARNGAHIRISRSAAAVLRMVREGLTFERIAELASAGTGRTVTASEVRDAYQTLAGRITAIEERESSTQGMFWLRRRILPRSIVAPVAARCSGAFRPGIAMAFGLVITIAGWLFVRTGLGYDPAHFWAGYALFVVSLLAHEMGHAAACERYGAPTGDIGFVMYFLYPAFYSDSTAAWALKRWQRVIVDLGGVYFQLVVGALYALLFWLSGWEPLRAAIVLIAGSCLLSMNPILKFDGYWVISDAMGVTNLGRQPQRIVQHLIDRLRGRPARPLRWSASVTWALCMYTIACIGFWIWFLWRMVPVLARHIERTASTLGEFFSRVTTERAWPGWPLVRDTITSAYILLFVAVLVVRLLRARGPRHANRAPGSPAPAR